MCMCGCVKAILILILCVTLWIYEGESSAQTGALLFCPSSLSLIGLIGVLGLQVSFPSSI